MHTTKLASGNTVHHNGAWEGILGFEAPPTVKDLIEVVLAVLRQDIVSSIENASAKALEWLTVYDGLERYEERQQRRNKGPA